MHGQKEGFLRKKRWLKSKYNYPVTRDILPYLFVIYLSKILGEYSDVMNLKNAYF